MQRIRRIFGPCQACPSSVCSYCRSVKSPAARAKTPTRSTHSATANVTKRSLREAVPAASPQGRHSEHPANPAVSPVSSAACFAQKYSQGPAACLATVTLHSFALCLSCCDLVSSRVGGWVDCLWFLYCLSIIATWSLGRLKPARSLLAEAGLPGAWWVSAGGTAAGPSGFGRARPASRGCPGRRASGPAWFARGAARRTAGGPAWLGRCRAGAPAGRCSLPKTASSGCPAQGIATPGYNRPKMNCCAC